MHNEYAKELKEFLDKSVSRFHAIQNIMDELNENGYQQLLESGSWKIEKGGKYYVVRNYSSIIAFAVPENDYTGFNIMASHSDSPTFKIKENPEMVVDGKYKKLNVEQYGGNLCAPWFDRPLSVSGRIIVKTDKGIETRLVDVDRDLLMITSLAIHMDRTQNEGHKYSVQNDMLPLFAENSDEADFMGIVAKSAGVEKEDILGNDLYLYNRMKGSFWGANEEFMSSGRIDDLQCAFASLKGLLMAKPEKSIPVMCVFDNEEVGSSTKQGADSTFLSDTLQRINECLGFDQENYYRSIARSFMMSADNAHAMHPNFAGKADPVNHPVLNGGVVIKYDAKQHYSTDAMAAAIFKQLCKEADVPFQVFVNNSDIPGGMTLGGISNTHVSLNTVDIGLAQLAMHSPYETVGVRDTEYMAKVAGKMFAMNMDETGCGAYDLNL